MSEKNTGRNKNTAKDGGEQTVNHSVTDGGAEPTDLTLFQHAALAVIAEEPRYGLAIKRELESFYETEVNHGRLYPNLDTLVEKGLVEKSERDRRTNEYAVTPAGERVSQQLVEWVAGRVGSIDVETDPVEADDDPRSVVDGILSGTRDLNDLIEIVANAESVLEVHKRLGTPSLQRARDVLDELELLTPGESLKSGDELDARLAELRTFATPAVDTGEGIVTDVGNSCAECGATLPEEIDDGTGVYCNKCGHGQLVTDGGPIPADSDMAAEPNPSQGSADPMAFVLEVMDLDDVSITSEEDRYIVSVRGLDRGVLDAENVIELANKYGHQVKDVYADVEQPALTIEVGR